MQPLSTTIMEDITATVEKIISKWEVGGSAYSKATYTSLFREGRDDAPTFLSSVVNLKNAMNAFLSHGSSGSPLLPRAHKLMESAMARLQKELHRLLSSNPPVLHPLSSSPSSLSSSSDVDKPTTATMDDLRSIAGCMLACGYTKECMKVYTSARRSVVKEGLSQLADVNMSPTQVRKLDWDAAERRIRRWVAGSRAAVRTLFAGERSLCDYVFGSSAKVGVKELVFAEVAKEPAVQFLRFPAMVSTKRKISPENIIHYLNLYDSISGLYPEIRSLFSYRSTAAVPSQARASLGKIGEIVWRSLDEFELAIQNDPKEEGSVPGGGLHPLTRYVMNYLCLLVDYTEVLRDILSDHPPLPRKPLPQPFAKLVSPATTVPSSPSREEEAGEVVLPPPVVSSRVAWLVLLLLGKLDGKAETYKDAALSYVFLANNVRYMVRKVRTSDDLRRLLGEEWEEEYEQKARSFARRYERLGWRRVVEAIPAGWVVERRGAEERMAEFEAAFEEAYRRQSAWVVTDRGMRDELKVSIAGKVMVPYKKFYDCYVEVARKEQSSAVVRFTPDDVGNYLSDLFYGAPVGSVSRSPRSSGSGSGYESGSGSSRTGRWRSG